MLHELLKLHLGVREEGDPEPETEQEAWPDAAELRKARRQEQLENTPIPEQVGTPPPLPRPPTANCN